MKSISIIKLNFLILAALIFGLSACNKPQELNPAIDDNIDNVITINNNLEELNARVKIVREPLQSSDNLKNSDTEGDCDNYTWYLVAEVDSPLFDGLPLSATDIRILGDKAYVSYNKKGNTPAGGVDILDISDPTAPVILSNMAFSEADINTLAVDNLGTDASRKIFLAGSSKNGAVLRQVIANEGYFIDGFNEVKLSKFYTDGSITASANGIGLTNDYIYITSGNTHGGTFQLDKQTLAILAHEEYSGAKAIALNGINAGDYQLSLIGGDQSKLNVYRVGTDRTLVHSWDLGSIIHQNVDDPYAGKSALSILPGEKIAYIAMNSRGAKGINIETGAEICASPNGMLPVGNTSGVAVDGKAIYLANGVDGLFIGCVPDGTGEISQVQKWGLNDIENSTNMVQTDGDWIFVAKGGGGLKILRKIANGAYPTITPWDDDGRPSPVDGTESFCENLLTDFNLSLSEGKDADKYHKTYFENPNREIVLTQNANVSVCFVSESAEYQNSLGYYTYNVNNTPKKIEDIESSMKVIFANTSTAGSGGSLVLGDRINLGLFPAGTVIGYFVIINGWDKNSKKVTKGLETFFTTPDLNRGNRQQSLMLYNCGCGGSLLTAFEDIKTNKGDRDFNDIVVKTNIDPITAINTSSVIHFPGAK